MNFFGRGLVYMKHLENAKGVTLIALVTTIIVLLILIGVSCGVVSDMILEKAVLASTETAAATKHELEELTWFENVDPFHPNKVLLRGNVKIGDCVAYPVEYYDVYTKEFYGANNGWIVIDDGSDSGNVKLISRGIPAKWFYKVENADELNDFTKMEELKNYENMAIKGESFMVREIANKVTTLSLPELNHLCNKMYGTNRAENDTSILDKDCELFALDDEDSYYWLATKNEKDSTKLYCVTYDSMESLKNIRLGVRPVIVLNKNLTGVLENGVWNIIK